MSDLSDDDTTDQNIAFNVDEIIDDMIDDFAVNKILEADEPTPKKWGGSLPGKAPNKPRNFTLASETLRSQYFVGDDSIYNEADFKRRFRMPRSVFQRIHSAIIGTGLFVQRQDCTKKEGIDPFVRLVACLKLLSGGNCADGYDEQFQMGESTLMESMKQFTLLVKNKFGEQYLNRAPTQQEKDWILTINKNRGFPGLIGSWDCKHFVWKNSFYNS